ncbi:MAG: VWA domain-containing protein [Gammaproteobacteria bacterium]|nr:VWA domain-containing protein [Gammaproteobacteria bacterium]
MESRVTLFRNVMGFMGALRKAGLPADPAGAIELCEGLRFIDIGSPADFQATARTTLMFRKEDLARFDVVFREYWLQQKRPFNRLAENDETEIEGPEPQPEQDDNIGDDDGPDKEERRASYSADEIIARKDLATLTDAEIERARRLIRQFVAAFATLRSRRHQRSRRGQLLDFRRMLRRTAVQGSDATEFYYRRRKIRRTRLMLLCDVSGSMERYSRFLLEFIYGLRRELPDTEVAVFATRMTVITDLLEARSVARSLREVARRAGDWGSGTDIGGCLRDFNDRYARDMLTTDTVVVLLSDGWDRGDAQLMRDEIEHLRRRAHRIIWLNPLLGNSDYEPLTRGMRTALPHLDHFLPAHNLESLARLAQTLRTALN